MFARSGGVRQACAHLVLGLAAAGALAQAPRPQTVAYGGHGDNRALVPEGLALPDPPASYRLTPVNRQFFVKRSYAFQL